MAILKKPTVNLGDDGAPLVIRCEKVGPRKSAIWDSTLGYPGEGPGAPTTFKIATQNMNGSLTGNAWNLLLREARALKIDLLFVQEHNLKSEDKRLETMRNCTLAHGFSYCHIACVPQCVGRGGTATLISDRVEVNNATSFDRCGGNMTVTNFELKKIKLRAVNVYAPQQELDPKGVPLETRRDHYYNKLKKHVTKSTILGGDFQNVLDVSLDLRRTANSAYENGGAEILRTIISENELEDEIRNGLGLGFDFTRCETVTSRGVTNTCQSRIDRIYHCIHQNLQWTSEILPIGEVCESDHAMVTLKMEIIEDSPETDTKKNSSLWTRSY